MPWNGSGSGFQSERMARTDLGGARGAVLERDAERVELLLQPADADAEDHPAVRQDVEARDLLGDVERDGAAAG